MLPIVRFIIPAVFVAISLSTSAQTISGKVASGDNNVSFATVTLLRHADSSVVAYTTTDNSGMYRIAAPQEGVYLLRVSSIGFLAQTKELSLSPSSVLTQDFVLVEDAVALQEAKVKGRYTGISFGTDTIRYNPQAFTDGSETVLGDVLNKLPGVEVDATGNIKAQGKDVSKVLLNGQDFFEGNTQVATKNLPADIAESVEVLSNYSEYSILKGFQSREQTVINVGVNKKRLGKISGTLAAAGGIEDKYKLKGDLMRIGSTSMQSLLAVKNNTGEETFSMMDYLRLQGGISELVGSTRGFNLSEEEQRLLMPQNNTYTRDDGLLGFNLSYQPKSKLKIGSYILYNNGKTKAEDLSSYTYSLANGGVYSIQERLNSTTKNNLLSGMAKVEYSPNPALSFVYRGAITYSDMNKHNDEYSNLGSAPLSALGQRDSYPIRTQHSATLMKLMGKHLLLTNAKLKYSSSPADYLLQTDSLLLPLPLTASNGWYYARQSTKQTDLSVELSSAFLYRIVSGYFIRFNVGYEAYNQRYTSAIAEYNPIYGFTVLGNDFANNLSTNTNDYYGSVDFIKNKGLIQLKFGATAHYHTYGGSAAKQAESGLKFQLNPTAELTLMFSQRHSLKTAFMRELSPNQLSAFIGNLVFNDARSYRTSSTFSQPYSTQYRTNISYNFYDMFSNTMVNFYASYSRFKRSHTNSYVQQMALSVANPIASDPTRSISAFLSFRKGLGIPWILGLNARYTDFTSHNRLSGIGNKITTRKVSGEVKLESKYKFPLNIECNAKLEHTENIPLLGNTTSQKVQRYGTKLKWTSGKKLHANAGIEYVKSQFAEYRQELYMLNANVRYTLSKSIELGLTGINILNLKKQSWTSVAYTANYMLERQFRQLPGYITLNASYRF